MSVLLLLLSIVFNPVPVLMSNKESPAAPNNTSDNYSQMIRSKDLNVQKNVSVKLQSTPHSLPDTNNNLAVMRLASRPRALPTSTSLHATASDGGHGRRNFNGFGRFTPADLMSSSALSPQTERIETSLSSLVSYSDTPERNEMGQKTKRSLSSSSLYATAGETKTSSVDVPVDPQVILKLDRNYTPKKIAEYIVSTGDERGITQVIADMVQDGQFMASGDDVILFLEAVQKELNWLRSRSHNERDSPKQATSTESSHLHFYSESDVYAHEIISQKHGKQLLHQLVSRSLKRKTKRHGGDDDNMIFE